MSLMFGTVQQGSSGGFPNDLKNGLFSYFSFNNGNQDDDKGSMSLINFSDVTFTGTTLNGDAAYFDRTSALNKDSVFPVDFSTGGTISLWIKSDGGSMSEPGLFISISNRMYLVIHNSTGYVYDNGTKVSNSTNLLDDEFHHIIYTWEKDSFTDRYLYVDGVLQDSDLGGTNISSTLNEWFSIGAYKTEALPIVLSPYEGIIDEIGLWSRLLTSSEVSELYNDGDGLFYV